LRAARYGAMAGIAITPSTRLPSSASKWRRTSQPPFDKHDTDLYKLVNRSNNALNNALEKSIAGPDM
jgi:hypothetical protein